MAGWLCLQINARLADPERSACGARESRRTHHEGHEEHEAWSLMNFNVTKLKDGIKRFVL
ncbi:hypothetical protein ACFL5Q_04960 [Planctomycetota bacterium]